MLCSRRTGLRVLHPAVVSLRLGEDAGGGGVPLQLVNTSVRRDSAKDGSALQISCKKTGRRKERVAATSQHKILKRKIFLGCFYLFSLPGWHLRVSKVLILVFSLQKCPSVYTSLMSFPISALWGDERKLPRLMVL